GAGRRAGPARVHPRAGREARRRPLRPQRGAGARHRARGPGTALAAGMRPREDAMDTETAHTVLGAIAAVLAVVWFVGLQFLYSAARKAREAQQDGEGREGWGTGSAEVDGDARTLATPAA